ncbi:MAG TPA: WecB/TagA/CpsF family glycosyltransferase [Dehalococcoidia bacterium]|nr:WecB/TagA/CpsF family glycosyltransferase [Dehalococcoidia bacterium]
MTGRQPEGGESVDVEILGVRFDNLTRTEAAERIAETAANGPRGYVVKPYSEFMARAARDQRFRDVLNQAALCLPDGVGIVWAAHYLSLTGGRLRALLQFPLSHLSMLLRPRAVRGPVREPMHGVDLTWEMLAALERAGASVYLLGGTTDELVGTRREIERRLPGLRIAGARHGYFRTGEENERVVAEVNAAKPGALLVAIGSPRQETWIADNMGRLEVNVAIAEGGSFSFISGATRRAPGWMRRAGLEWLFRLLRQPHRVRRQMALPVFVWRVFRERWARG